MTGTAKRDPALPLPELEIYDHVSASRVLSPTNLAELTALAKSALPDCLDRPGDGGKAAPVLLGALPVIEISVVSDAAIAAVHRQFMDDPTPTDVITFHHGEILVSLDTARAEAGTRQQPVLRELLLYVVHGLLHLNGHADAEEAPKQRMHAIQDEILDRVWPLPDAPET